VSIVLIGLPASGKTTVGMEVAGRLGMDFADTDAMVEERTGKLIGEIFADEGEAYFRQLEEEAAAEALMGISVVSLGGGAVMNPRIREMLFPHQVIWLDVSIVTLTRRAGMTKLRPLLLGDVREQLTVLAADRLPVYEQVATWRVDGELPVYEVVAQILSLISGTAIPPDSPIAPVNTPVAALPAPDVLPDLPVTGPEIDVIEPQADLNLVQSGSWEDEEYPLLLVQAGSRPPSYESTPTDMPSVIRVNTDHPYNVLVGHGVAPRVVDYLSGVSRAAIVYPPVLDPQAIALAKSLPHPIRVEVPDSEQAKTSDVLDWCWRTLAEAGVTRSDAVIGLGGGSTTDLAGFVAATMLRGMTYITIPTTVLGMADASLGGKTGINLPQGKNLVGAFYEPCAVLCDLDMLATLPAEEVRSGLGEILKCGFIADPEILHIAERDEARLSDTGSPEFADALTRAIRVKAGVVSADFRENSTTGAGREALNYGHTLAHAIEKVEGFTWAHGFAVSVGMVFAAEVASRLGMVTEDAVTRMKRILKSVGLPVRYSGAPWAQIREAMSMDKKARGSHLRLVLLDGIGKVRVVADVDEDLLRESFHAIGGVE